MPKPTIYDVMRAALGREPTSAELKSEVVRIIADARGDLARKISHDQIHGNSTAAEVAESLDVVDAYLLKEVYR